MSKIDRRNLVVGAVAVGLTAACADGRPTPRPILVSIRSADGGYSVAVDDEEIDISELDSVILARAMAAYPSRSETYLRQNVRIYIRTDGNIEYPHVLDAMDNMTFEKIGFVAEDRRR